MMMVHNNATFGDDSTDRSTTPPCPCVVPSCPKSWANTTLDAPTFALESLNAGKRKQKKTSETSAEDGTRATTQQQPTNQRQEIVQVANKTIVEIAFTYTNRGSGMQNGVMGPGSDRCHQPRHHTVAYPFPRPSIRLLVRQKTSAAASIMKSVRVCDILAMI